MINISPPVLINGSVSLPLSKSLANRLLILNALRDFQLADLGEDAPDDVKTLSAGLFLSKNNRTAVIDVGHAGTAMRFLTAYLSQTEGEWTLTGSERMQKRPIAILVNALRELGAKITYLKEEGFPPLLIKGAPLTSTRLKVSSEFSSQYISALLLVAPFIKNGLQLELLGTTVSEPYIQMTVNLLQQAGASLRKEGTVLNVAEGLTHTNTLRPEIEADWTSASYYFSICALSPNAKILLKGLQQTSLQGDAVLPTLFENLGVHSQFTTEGLLIEQTSNFIREFSYNCIDCPDLAQTLAVTCAGLGVHAHLSGLSTLKIKETDRIVALQNELRKCGLKVSSGVDFIEIFARESLLTQPASIDTYEDHRMAMAFSALCLVQSPLFIRDEQVVTKSYPSFWEHLISLGFSVNLQPH